MPQMNSEQKKLAQENMGLVGATVARMRLHYDLDDLYGVGYIGLCKAALHFRPGGLCFTTYATHIIRRELITYLNKNSPSRGPLFVSLETQAFHEFPDGADDFAAVESRLAARQAVRNLEKFLDADDAALARLMLKGLDLQALADAAGLSESTVMKAKRRILQRLKAWLNGDTGQAAAR